MEIRYGKYAQRDFIADVLKIDSLVYPEDMRGTYCSVNERFMSNRDSYLLVYDDDRLVGYLCLFPITDELYSSFASSDVMVDDNITPSQICKYRYINNLFLISVAILPRYRNKTAVVMLTEELKTWIRNNNETGYVINSITAIAISEDGSKFLKSLQFELVRVIEGNHELFVCDAAGIERLTSET